MVKKGIEGGERKEERMLEGNAFLLNHCNHKGLGLYYLCLALLFGVSGTL